MMTALARFFSPAETTIALPPAKAAMEDSYPGVLSSPAYEAGWFDKPDTATFWPSQSSADTSTLPYRDLSLARVRDIIRNDPIAGAAVERLVDLVVGKGLHLVARPDAVALGITPDEARAVGKQIQAEWRLFANDPRRFCDIQRRMTIDGFLRQQVRTWIIAGETLYALTLNDDKFARYRTSFITIDPDRLSNPMGQIETLTLRGGVEMDSAGAPIAYHIRNAHASDWWAYGKNFTWTRVPRATAWGRPIVVHGFEPEREGQTRSISPFAGLVRRLRMITKFGEAELATAAVNAMFAAFVETDLPTDEVANRLTPQSTTFFDRTIAYFTNNPARVNGARIPVMPPGSKITVNGSPRQTTAFPAFETAFLQKIAARLGLSYEQLAMDWTKTNYSSARAALNEVWRHVQRVRAAFTEQVVSPLYFAFLEEAIDSGHVTLPKSAPDFHDMPGAWARARWIGPGRGYVDPVKEAQGATVRLESMISTFEIECAEQGLDYEDVFDQIERENAEMQERGLERLSLVAAVQSVRGTKPDSEEATGPAGPGGEDTETASGGV